jgi:hypothetical protein
MQVSHKDGSIEVSKLHLTPALLTEVMTAAPFKG